MPSPFPGMDPFLEDPEIFPDLHDSMITYSREVLQQALPDPYYAVIGRRAWIEVSERFIGPDDKLLTSRQREPKGATVLAASRSQPVVVHVPHDERSQTLLDVFTRKDGDKRLVTSIEVLSPINKASGEQGRRLYLRKQREILGSKVNLVEIDLLRHGEHTTAVPRGRMERDCGPCEYHVCVRRFDNLEDYYVYPIRLAERLPEVRVPLLPGDGDVPLDLQSVFDRCYDTGPYRREVRYDVDVLRATLTDAQSQWVSTLLAAKSGS